MQIQPLRGFREFYPEEMTARRKVIASMLKVVESYGFRETESPSLEPLELFRLKSGDEIVDGTFSFTDKGGREVTLIPETTPAVARMVSQKKTLVKPIKWYSFSRLWRYEEPQAGRFREFYQVNIDIFGVEGIEAEAEVVAVAVNMLVALGLKEEFVIKISDRILLQRILQLYGVKDLASAYRLIDKRNKLSKEEFVSEFDKIASKNMNDLLKAIEISGRMEPSLSKLMKIVPEDKIVNERIERLLRLASLLKSYGVEEQCILDMSVVRGIAYYTDTVFECYDAKGQLRALFGGGRYDELVQLFGGERIPAVGFALGDAVLELLVRRAGKWPKEELKTSYFVLVTDRKYLETGIRIVENLRKIGMIVEYDLLLRSMSKQMKYADKIGAEKVIILGEKEMNDGRVAVRDMRSGEQREMELKEFVG